MNLLNNILIATRGMSKTTMQTQYMLANFLHITYDISLEEAYKLAIAAFYNEADEREREKNDILATANPWSTYINFVSLLL